MFNKIRNYFSYPVFGEDQEKTNTARILFLVLKFYFFVSLFMLIGDIFIFVRKLAILLAVLIFIMVLSFAGYIARKGKIRPAGYLIVVFIWCLYTPIIWFSGGVSSLVAITYLVISILAGLILGRSTSIAVALTSCLTLMVMYVLETSGINPPKYFPMKLQSIVFIWLSTFILVVPVVSLAFKILSESLLVKKKEVEERKLVEAALRDSENKFRRIFENVQDVFYQIDLNGIIVEISPSIIRYSGYTREELLGTSVERIYYNLNDRDAFISKVMESGEIADTELRLKTKDGIPKIASLSLHKYYDSNGNFAGFEGSMRDISERKKIETALIESEEKMRMIIEATSYLFFYTQDANANITYVSPSVEKITGHTVEQWIGQKHWYTTDSEINKYAKIKTHSHLRGEIDNETILLEVMHANGNCIFLEAYETPVIKDNKVIGIHGIAHDITARKKAEDDLKANQALLIAARDKAEEMNRLKTSLLNNMSHELRTPLIGIMGFAEILESELEDAELKTMVSKISTGGKRLFETLNMVLNLSKIEAEKLGVVRSLFNVSEVTFKRVANYDGAAKVKGLIIQTFINDKCITINSDERIYSQILDNLVNNAIKFTNNGSISVHLNKEVKCVDGKTKCFIILKVVDTGIGIAQDDFDLIFEEYRQVSVGLSRSFQGTGLGLTITKRFVEILGGTITVESELGSGSTFTVTLPA